MAQITIYVPDDVAQRLRREARKANKSLSAYLTELAVGGAKERAWPKWFFGLEGSCAGTLELPDDPPEEEPDAL